MGEIRELVLIANARMPSPRAQSLQVAQATAAFARRGLRTELWHAARRETLALPPGADLWDYYAVPRGARPGVRALACVDWIERVPRRLQYLPARMQELSFARSAARAAARLGPAVAVLSRELEAAAWMPERRRLFLEIHRVPGGSARRRWLGRAVARAAGVIAISGGVRDDLLAQGVPPEAVRVEHDAFEPERFQGLPSRAAARAELGLPAEATVVVYTGGLLEWKGVDVLVEAARSLPELRFVIVGGMPADVERLRERARGLAQIRFEGFQPPARVATFLAAADLGVVPNRSTPAISARYTSPLKVFEAMAVGLPLVVSDLPSLREILAPEEALFCAPDRPEPLAEAIASLVRDPARARALGERLRARAPRHSWDARAARLLAWMEERS